MNDHERLLRESIVGLSARNQQLASDLATARVELAESLAVAKATREANRTERARLRRQMDALHAHMDARDDTNCHACGRSLPQWTKGQIVTQMRKFSATHGRAPKAYEWKKVAWHRPSSQGVVRLFGSWNNAVDAAGLERPYRKDAQPWTRDQVIRAIWDFQREHGRPPMQDDWPRSTASTPGWHVARRLFGTWNAAIVAAGYEPRRRRRPAKAAA